MCTTSSRLPSVPAKMHSPSRLRHSTGTLGSLVKRHFLGVDPPASAGRLRDLEGMEDSDSAGLENTGSANDDDAGMWGLGCEKVVVFMGDN